jgi:hypothetical protein
VLVPVGLGCPADRRDHGTGSFVRKSSTRAFTRCGFSWIRKCDVPGTIAGSAFGSASNMSTACVSVIRSSSENFTSERCVTLAG